MVAKLKFNDIFQYDRIDWSENQKFGQVVIYKR